jgi:uncharacterized membrane protein YhhN
MICSLCFVATGLIGSANGQPGPVPAYDGLMIAGLVFSLLGDLALVWSGQRRPFILGLICFLVAHLFYTVAFTLANGLSAWDLPVFAVLLGWPLLAYRSLDIDLGKMKLPCLAYLVVISFMLTKALSTLYLGGITGQASWLVMLGALLFYISDAVLALHKFHRHPKAGYRAVNLTTYYVGQMLLALSVYFF